jgi:putative pyruvate formate lyase activating enzyme
MTAAYLHAQRSGLLEARIEEARCPLSPCHLCPRGCGVDRLGGERGYCRGGLVAEVASYGPHFGEESVLVGSGGSGTIFFCGCNLLCDFCQNYSLSRRSDEECREVSAQDLARVMLELQRIGCANINLVTPSHVVPQILAALSHAAAGGLHLPLVYNCGGYESISTLRLLDGIVDIYMPDAKFLRAQSALTHTQAADYPQVMGEALVEMQRQVGDLVIDEDGLARRGLLVRHLLMPESLDEAGEIFTFLAEQVSRNCYLNIMDQFRPCGEYRGGTEDTITPDHYRQALRAAGKAGLTRLHRHDTSVLLRRLLGR